MNTIAATSQRIPRPALIGIVVLVIAVVALMVVRLGVLSGGSGSGAAAVTASPQTGSSPTPTSTKAVAAKPKIVLLPNLPASVAHALRYSKVTVVSLYVGQAPGDHASVTEARKGARSAGAGFVAVNVGNDKQASTVATFAGEVSSPSTLIVRRPGKIVMQVAGPVESAVVAQAAHNAGARR